MQGYLGWDVGAWHCQQGGSRDALVLLTDNGGPLRLVGRPWRGNLRESFNHRLGPSLLGELLRLVGAPEQPWTALTVAIDTPLGWPAAFRALLAGRAPEAIPATKGENPLLLRATERWLHAHGHPPLSAVQDLIGSQSTKGLAVLAALGLREERPGVWTGAVGPIALTAVEAYPAPCRRSPSVRALHAPLAAALGAVSEDVTDALTCGLVAHLFARQPQQLAAPPEAPPGGEGWIQVPWDCLGPGSNPRGADAV